MRWNSKHLLALTVLFGGHLTSAYAAELIFTFAGQWEDVFKVSNPAGPLSTLIGTPFTGSVVIPTSGIDLDPDPTVGYFEFLPSDAQFNLDASGTVFDFSQPPIISVGVYNDRSEYGSVGPYFDSIVIIANIGGFSVSLDAGIKNGFPPTAFDSDEIPTPAEILSTAAITVALYSASSFRGDVLLSAAHPLPALYPPGSVNDLLDVQVTAVPLPPALLNALMGVCTIGVAVARKRPGMTKNASRDDPVPLGAA